MKKAKTEIDFQDDEIITFGKKVKTYFISTGHYCVKLDNKFSNEDNLKSNIFLCHKTEK